MFGEYATVAETAEKWGLKERTVQTMCQNGRIKGAKKFGRDWAIPAEAKRPADKRVVTGQYIGYRENKKLMEVKTAKNGKEFLSEAKLYVANMEKNKKMLHIRGCKNCHWASFMYSYIDFDTLEEAEAFSPRLAKCENCFSNQ